jgi:cytochrome c556
MKAIWTAVAALGLVGCAATMDEQALAPAQQQPTPQQIVAARQTAFHLTGAAMGNMRAAAERGGDVSGQAYAARGVARWAAVLPTMFPPSTTAVTPSRAKPEIWTNRPDFDAKAAAFAAAVTRLAELAQANDKEGFAAQHRATAATCAACHDLYQVPQNRGG